MRTLVYKRTHHGDPGPEGRFGISDCMGRVRTWDFEAVIGVGGSSAKPKKEGLAYLVNWIGIGPLVSGQNERGPILKFEHFKFYGNHGPDFRDLAPDLSKRMYLNNVRVVMKSLSKKEQKEVQSILAMAKNAPPSSAARSRNSKSSKKGARSNLRLRSVKSCSR